jgi:uncharacterized membrane protein
MSSLRFMSISQRAINKDAVTLATNLAYPFLVYGALRYLPPMVLALAFAAFLALRLALAALNRSGPIRAAEIWLVMAAGGGALIWALVSPVAGLKAYPIFVNMSFAAVFAYSLFFPPTVVERIARLRQVECTPYVLMYFRRVTAAWLGFFLLNGTVSALTALSGNLELWTLYNGLISYLMIGSMFAGELIIRRRVRARLNQAL